MRKYLWLCSFKIEKTGKVIMVITEKTDIYVYGYGVRGNLIRQTLQNQGLKVVAFIDRNAEKYVDENTEIPILRLQDFSFFSVDFSNSIVIIAVSNIFEHEKIANTLVATGFLYIIGKLPGNDSVDRTCSKLYDKTVDYLEKSSIICEKIPLFQSRKNNEEQKMAAIVYTVVPIDMLFGMTEKIYDAAVKGQKTTLKNVIADKSILYFNLAKGLFQAFMNGMSGEMLEEYFQIYYDSRMLTLFTDGRYKKESVENFKKHILDRYTVYQNMEKIYDRTPGFFTENPASVEWNEEGYFNIQDGNHRSCFLLLKGFKQIPCKMRREDYEKWLNSDEKVEAVKRALDEIEEPLYAPISHPKFQEQNARYYAWSYKKLRCLCEWLYKKQIDITHRTILTVFGKNDFCGRHFARMGAEVSIYESKEWQQLQKSVDDLLHIKGIHYLKSMDECEGRDYDLILYHCESADEVEKMPHLCAERMIIELKNADRSTLDVYRDALCFQSCEILMERLVESDIITLVCMEK